MVGFAGGVFFFPHYWMQLVGPLCLLGALALSLLPGRLAMMLVLLVCLPATSWTVRAAAAGPDRRDRLAVPDSRLLANRDIAPWLRAHAGPTDQLYAFVSSADLYYRTGLHTDFRYLWQANLEAIPAASASCGTTWPARPAGWVVLYQRPDLIDPTGTSATAGGRLPAGSHHRRLPDPAPADRSRSERLRRRPRENWALTRGIITVIFNHRAINRGLTDTDGHRPAQRDLRGAGRPDPAGDPGPAVGIRRHRQRTRRTVQISLPAISRHLKVLEKAGLITRSRSAQWRSSSLRAEPLREATAWMERYRMFWDANLDRLDAHLKRLQQQPTDLPSKGSTP